MSTGRFAFVGRRIGQSIPLAFAVLVAVFLMLKLVPGDPARQVAGPRATEEQVARIRESLGLNDSLLSQFWSYLGRLAHGDLGTNANGSLRVGDIITQNAPVTILVVLLSIVFAVGIAVTAALLASRRPQGLVDRALQAGAAFAIGIPSFWMGIVLLITVALPTGAFPTGGWGKTSAEHLNSAILPAFTLAIAIAPVLFASLRAAILEVTRSDFYTAARASGVSGVRLIRQFVLRNAAVPPVALLASLTTILLSGAVVVEATFGLPGLGLSLVDAGRERDFNVVQGLTLVFALAVIGVNLLGDILIAVLDPRVVI